MASRALCLATTRTRSTWGIRLTAVAVTSTAGPSPDRRVASRGERRVAGDRRRFAVARLNCTVNEIDRVYQYSLVLAARADDWRDQALGPIHLLKYAYLADLEHAERNDGATYTGTPWRFFHFGPWDVDAHERTALVEQAGADKKTISSPYRDYDRYRFSSQRADQIEATVAAELPLGVRGLLQRAVREHGADTPGLLRHVYLTPPMLAARPNEVLDFTTAIEQVEPPVSTAKRDRRARTRAKKRQWTAARNAAREKIRKALDKRRAEAEAAAKGPQPNYDDVFFAGLEALDRLAGEPLKPTSGTLIFDDSVWSSSQRRDPDVP